MDSSHGQAKDRDIPGWCDIHLSHLFGIDVFGCSLYVVCLVFLVVSAFSFSSSEMKIRYGMLLSVNGTYYDVRGDAGFGMRAFQVSAFNAISELAHECITLENFPPRIPITRVLTARVNSSDGGDTYFGFQANVGSGPSDSFSMLDCLITYVSVLFVGSLFETCILGFMVQKGQSMSFKEERRWIFFTTSVRRICAGIPFSLLVLTLIGVYTLQFRIAFVFWSLGSQLLNFLSRYSIERLSDNPKKNSRCGPREFAFVNWFFCVAYLFSELMWMIVVVVIVDNWGQSLEIALPGHYEGLDGERVGLVITIVVLQLLSDIAVSISYAQSTSRGYAMASDPKQSYVDFRGIHSISVAVGLLLEVIANGVFIVVVFYITNKTSLNCYKSFFLFLFSFIISSCGSRAGDSRQGR